MAYTRNFGIRSFENIVRAGRNKTAATGTPLTIGQPVVINNQNTVVLAGNAAAPGPLAGFVVYEHIQYQGTDPLLSTPTDETYTKVPLGRHAQVTRGPGVKLWFKNTPAKTLYDGRVQPAAEVVVMTGLAVGDGLVPDGTGKLRKAAGGATPETAWAVVEHLDTAAGLVEARLTF